MKYKAYFSDKTQVAHFPKPYHFEMGGKISEFNVAYRSWGKLNSEGTNAVLICHALTGSADADIWWGDLFGEGKTFDTSKDFIISSNVLGSCYGTTGPISINPETGKEYGAGFPQFTIRDMVSVQHQLLVSLGVKHLKMVIGGSMGGMQVLEWGNMFPDFIDCIVPIATSARHSAWCIGLSESQRQAIYADPNWKEGYYKCGEEPKNGLSVARTIAMCTYRSRASFQTRFARSERHKGEFNVESYLRYQGEKMIERFDANSYVKLTKAMDLHDISRGRGTYSEVLENMTLPALVIGISSDILYPQEEQEEISRIMPNAKLDILYSPHGHDTFLIEMDALNFLVTSFQKMLDQEISEASAHRSVVPS